LPSKGAKRKADPGSVLDSEPPSFEVETLPREPEPPRGYWAKKAAGHRTTRRPKLPKFDDMKAAERHRQR